MANHVWILCDVYEIEFDREHVLSMIPPGDDGETTLERLGTCLHKLGMESHVVQGDATALTKWQGPMILHVRNDSGLLAGHFGIAIFDPASGHLFAYDPLLSRKSIQVEMDVLQNHWTGYAILVGPPPKPMLLQNILIAVVAATLGFGGTLLIRRMRRTNGFMRSVST